MLNVGPAAIEVTYARFGDPADPPVLLIMGAGSQPGPASANGRPADWAGMMGRGEGRLRPV